jgi:hypothetical protein
MPAAKKAPAKKAKARKTRARSASKARTSKRAGAGAASSHRTLGRLSKSLEAVQREISGLGGSMGDGGTDLRKDIERLLRDASRGLSKLSANARREAERLQKELSSATKPKRKRAGAKPKAKRAAAKPKAKRAAAKAKSASKTTKAGSAKKARASKPRASRARAK